MIWVTGVIANPTYLWELIAPCQAGVISPHLWRAFGPHLVTPCEVWQLLSKVVTVSPRSQPPYHHWNKHGENGFFGWYTLIWKMVKLVNRPIKNGGKRTSRLTAMCFLLKRLASWEQRVPIGQPLPWKINGWNLQITHLERKMIFQTSMIVFHVNLQGCIALNELWMVFFCVNPRGFSQQGDVFLGVPSV